MLRRLKKQLVPSEENAFVPDLLGPRVVGLLSLLIVLVFAVTATHTRLLLSRGGELAAVISSTLVDLTNENRSIYSLPPVTINPILTKAAQSKARDMAAKGYFSHNTPEGLTPWHWFDQVGYQFIFAGENLAINFNESKYVSDAWMDSPGHRANILNGNFTEIGIATAEGVYEGKPTIFVVQLFGRPIISQATSAVVATAPVVPTNATPTPAPVSQPATPTAAPQPTPTKTAVETIVETDTFIVVKNTALDILESVTPARPSVGGSTAVDSLPVNTLESPVLGTTQYGSVTERLITDPERVLTIGYAVIAAFVIFALLSALLRSHKTKKKTHFASGMFLIMLMAGLIYLYQYLVVAEVIVL